MCSKCVLTDCECSHRITLTAVLFWHLSVTECFCSQPPFYVYFIWCNLFLIWIWIQSFSLLLSCTERMSQMFSVSCFSGAFLQRVALCVEEGSRGDMCLMSVHLWREEARRTDRLWLPPSDVVRRGSSPVERMQRPSARRDCSRLCDFAFHHHVCVFPLI